MKIRGHYVSRYWGTRPDGTRWRQASFHFLALDGETTFCAVYTTSSGWTLTCDLGRHTRRQLAREVPALVAGGEA